MKRLLSVSLSVALTFGSMLAHGQFDHQHGAWTALLRKHVVLIDGGKASQVRYAGVALDRKAEIRHLDYDWGLNDARK